MQGGGGKLVFGRDGLERSIWIGNLLDVCI
jgi:hypothetical protein